MFLAVAAGCVPYTVATTAQPVPRGEVAPALVWYAIPNGIEVGDDTTSSSGAAVAFMSLDMETRVGVSDRADVGLRIPAASGIVATYKYRLSAFADPYAPAMAIMVGGGLVNLGNHAHVELTLLASGPQARFTAYGGLKIGQVLPLSSKAKSDSPTAGGFFGVRIGTEQLGVGAEVGVFYDHSTLGLRSSDLIVVPAVVVHGAQLLEALSGAMGGGRRRR